VAIIIERLKVEQKVDVFRTVKDLRDYRPGMFDEMVKYWNCSSILICCILALFSIYDRYVCL